jgi:hypothetical protein
VDGEAPINGDKSQVDIHLDLDLIKNANVLED